MDRTARREIDKAKTYQEKAILYLLLATDDANDERIKHVYETMWLIFDERKAAADEPAA